MFYLFTLRSMNYTLHRYFFVSAFFMIGFFQSQAQEVNGWKVLSDVSFVSKTDELLGYEIEAPVFGSKVLALVGKQVQLKGYFVPLEEMRGHKYFVLSSLPFNICFFCGAAGPETVIEVYSKNEIPFTEKAITIKGTLELNADDPLHLMYLLKNAELITDN